MSSAIKICGVQTPAMAQAIVAAGATHLGINLVPSSRRCLSVTRARAIAQAVKGTVQLVGVFQDHPYREVLRLTVDLSLDALQLHGSESPAYVARCPVPVIKAVRSREEATRYPGVTLLIDRVVQGEGLPVDLSLATELARSHRLFLAGGLTPKTVGRLVRTIRPYGVDVAGGVEQNGTQDLQRIHHFIHKVLTAL